jgi:hypothetical protein
MLSFAENCSPSLSVVGDKIAGFEQGQNPSLAARISRRDFRVALRDSLKQIFRFHQHPQQRQSMALSD